MEHYSFFSEIGKKGLLILFEISVPDTITTTQANTPRTTHHTIHNPQHAQHTQHRTRMHAQHAMHTNTPPPIHLPISTSSWCVVNRCVQCAGQPHANEMVALTKKSIVIRRCPRPRPRRPPPARPPHRLPVDSFRQQYAQSGARWAFPLPARGDLVRLIQPGRGAVPSRALPPLHLQIAVRQKERVHGRGGG